MKQCDTVLWSYRDDAEQIKETSAINNIKTSGSEMSCGLKLGTFLVWIHFLPTSLSHSHTCKAFLEKTSPAVHKYGA